MERYTRFFTTTDGARIAYATLGSGPPLVHVPAFLSHLEVQWEAPAYRAFSEALSADFTHIRYDRYGCGLSDRDRVDFSLDVDVQVLAGLVDHLRLRRFALLGPSAGGPVAVRYAALEPRRVSHLLLFGTGWQGKSVGTVRGLLHQLIRADPRLGSNALADFFVPGVDPETQRWLARLNWEAASAETIVGLSEATFAHDLGEVLPGLHVPTLVMHRRGDRIVPLETAREIAARIPGARFAAMPGDEHILEFGDIDAVLRAVRDFVDAPLRRRPTPAAASATQRTRPAGLSARETEILDLIAAGLSNRQIAERLSISVHTVERHTANLYTKLGVRGRVEATAYALARSSGTTPTT